MRTLSGGNVQRAVLARELGEPADLLLVANPVFGLDFAAVAEIHARLRAARDGGTAVLLVSSFFMNRAETQMGQGDQKGFLISTTITLLLGLGFLAGVVGIEWREAPFAAADSAYSAVFFMMTGMHAFHVLTGVIFLGIILNNGRRGLYTPEKHWAVEAATVYWHFIDVVWIFFYPALYLIGKLI